MSGFRILVFVILISSNFCLSLTITQFLGETVNGGIIENGGKRPIFVKDNRYLKKFEYRSSTEDSDLSKHALRVSFRGWGEADAINRFADAELKQIDVDNEIILNQLLKKRYDLVVNYFHFKNSLQLNQKLKVLYKDRITVLKQSINTLNFDINDLIKAQDAFNELNLDLISLEERWNYCCKEIAILALADKVLQFDETELIDIELLSARIDFLCEGDDDENIFLLKQKRKVEKEKSKVDLEIAKNRDYLSFFEVEYDDNNRDDDKLEPLTFKAGFQIPIIKTGQFNLSRHKIKYYSEKDEYTRLKQSFTENRRSLVSELSILVKQYFNMDKARKESDMESTYSTLLSMEGIDPLSLLKVKESILKNEIIQEKIKYEIYQKYLELLSVNGKMVKKPLVNYLSSDFNKL